MKNIELIRESGPGAETELAEDKDVKELFNGPFRKVIEVRLQNNSVLPRHKADVPITVFCLSGKGIFSAGSDLEDSLELRAGTLITLEAGVEHEVIADPSIHIIVTKFKNS